MPCRLSAQAGVCRDADGAARRHLPWCAVATVCRHRCAHGADLTRSAAAGRSVGARPTGPRQAIDGAIADREMLAHAPAGGLAAHPAGVAPLAVGPGLIGRVTARRVPVDHGSDARLPACPVQGLPRVSPGPRPVVARAIQVWMRRHRVRAIPETWPAQPGACAWGPCGRRQCHVVGLHRCRRRADRQG